MKEVLILLGVGVIIGLSAAVGLSHLVQSQLYGLKPHDPLTLVLSTIALGMVACLAGFIPALRASRIDPMHALRFE
jgi:ABC-type antimicrobial peptide transport system permease subunit